MAPRLSFSVCKTSREYDLGAVKVGETTFKKRSQDMRRQRKIRGNVKVIDDKPSQNIYILKNDGYTE